MCADAIDIFTFLRAHGIGQGFALFYEAWAALLERKEDFATADRVYQEGVRAHAAPIERLRQRHADFQHRCAFGSAG